MTTAPTPPTLADLHRKYNRANVSDIDSLQMDVDQFIAQTVNLDADTLNELAGIYSFVAENIEREAWRYYTSEEWRQLEHEYVEKAGYTKPDLFDDITTAYEADKLTEDEAKATALEYRECRHIFCLNVFKPGRKDQRYCSADCRYRHAQAKERAKVFPFTYLPPSAYKENRDATDEANYQANEVTFDDSVIIGKLEPFERSREYGYKRDRDLELIYDNVNGKSTKKLSKYGEISAKRRDRNPVLYEESYNDRTGAQAGSVSVTF